MAARPCFGKVTHCIFDNDGLLMETENLYRDGVQLILNPYKKTYTYDVQLRIMGQAPIPAAKILIKEYGLPLKPAEVIKQLNEHVMRLMQNVKLKPGAKELLLHLKECHVPMAMATGSVCKTFQVKARPHQDLLPVFRHIVFGDDPQLKRGKPAPDIYLLAAARFKPRAALPERCLAFEDAPNGVLAARKAGMQVVMVPDARVPEELRKHATLVLPSLECFRPEDFGLPAYDNCSKFEFG